MPVALCPAKIDNKFYTGRDGRAPKRYCGTAALAGWLGLMAPGMAAAQSVSPATPPAPPAATGLMSQPNLLGDAWGLRPALDARGVSLAVQASEEVFGNPTGGLHRSVAFNGMVQLTLGVDFAKAVGWTGATLNISALQISGRNFSADNLASLQTASGLEASRASRLWEAWLQQSLFGGKVSIRAGQQSLDQEFIVSAGSSVFINTAMGWPMLPSADLYAGGPAYPLASLGVRVNYQPNGKITFLAGLFDDNANGGAAFTDSSQLRGAAQSGTAFSLGTGTLAIAEMQYAVTPFGTALHGTYKIGGWFDTGSFADQRVGADGMSLADPASDHVPRGLRTNWSAYAVMDQSIWQPDPSGPRQVAVFARIMAAPSDRNAISFSINGGVTFKQPLPGRDNDTLGLGFGVAKISNAAAALGADMNRLAHAGLPVRSAEAFVELTYQVQLAPWLSVQPDVQYVVRPGGGIADPGNPGHRIGNEAVAGVRGTLNF